LFVNRTDGVVAKLSTRDELRRASREMATGTGADYSEALERGLSVLTAFDHAEQRLTQAQLARKLDLPRATVRRAVLTLVHLGFVTAEDKMFRLTPRVLTLASAYLTTNPISYLLQPVCDRLAEQFQTSCTTAVLDGPEAVMIARALPRQSLAVGEGIGFRIPAVHSALGRVLLGAMPAEERHRYLGALPDGGLAPTELDEILDQVTAQGFAYAANEVEAGFHSIAVPLRRWDDTVVAALNIGAHLERLTEDDMHEKVLPVLRQTAAGLRAQLV
jgi:IclR family pca regulon transcriptional regulator